jgi:hypothetical protein
MSMRAFIKLLIAGSPILVAGRGASAQMLAPDPVAKPPATAPQPAVSAQPVLVPIIVPDNPNGIIRISGMRQ